MRKLRTKAAEGFIETDSDIRAGLAFLRRSCGMMRRAHDIAGDPPLRRRAEGFDGLARIIVGQQLSIASAAAIWGRLEGLSGTVTAGQILQHDEDELRRVGLSGAKIRTLRAAAQAATTGALPIEALARIDDARVHEALCAVKGIGPWTADIYIMFCLGRADAFAAGDLALQIAAGHVAGLDQRPSPRELLTLAEAWRPWRGVAARLLWSYYPHIRKIGAQAGTAAPV